MKRRSVIGAAVVSAFGLKGCGGDDSEAENGVEYAGTDLIVDGKLYKRTAPPVGAFAPAAVIAAAVPGREAEFSELIRRYSLAVVRSGSAYAVIAVPAQFEWQWARALAAHPSVRSAELNGLAGPASAPGR